ncbi:MAG TPA: DNA-binding response regulator [Bacteroidales bacterium]|nr:MAG: DNA-binding response regulator [Bacteroidetes bacterium GWF2_33_38]OFY68198.1 MAG: DNA-binding response regulator [Bacteroidetes bacterium RIFOXYA12_FULL_33_9]OFY84848.1 MAG: DNA-binding response regulator [Bacteroidetes bacterium RIFOXYA2_FULL_33_7]HBF87503.1 DNA-binding response regulator [Bacteroidales bacterium]
MNTCNITIVDDHHLFRNGLKLLLNGIENFKVVNEAENGLELLKILLKEGIPDVILLDIEMPIMNGIEAAEKVLSLYPDAKIIVLSMYSDEEYYYKLINIGVKGFLLKNSNINDVETAIVSICNGGNYFSAELLLNTIKNIKKINKQPDIDSGLSEREIEILIDICKGFSNQEIANKLFISKRTVDKHRANIMEKTDSKNTANLIMYSIKNNIIQLP